MILSSRLCEGLKVCEQQRSNKKILRDGKQLNSKFPCQAGPERPASGMVTLQEVCSTITSQDHRTASYNSPISIC